MLPLICDRCGKPFEKRPDNLVSTFGLACSPECRILITLSRCPNEKVKRVYLHTLGSGTLVALLKCETVTPMERTLILEAQSRPEAAHSETQR